MQRLTDMALTITIQNVAEHTKNSYQMHLKRAHKLGQCCSVSLYHYYQKWWCLEMNRSRCNRLSNQPFRDKYNHRVLSEQCVSLLFFFKLYLYRIPNAVYTLYITDYTEFVKDRGSCTIIQ